MPRMHDAVMAQKKKLYVQALRVGSTHELASDYAGIGRTTAWQWRRAGEDGDEDHVDFFNDCISAMGKAGLELVALVREAAKEDWRAGAWMLERRHPEQWSKHESRTIETKTPPPDLSGFSHEEILAMAKESDQDG